MHQTEPRKGAQFPAVCYPQACCSPDWMLLISISETRQRMNGVSWVRKLLMEIRYQVSKEN